MFVYAFHMLNKIKHQYIKLKTSNKYSIEDDLNNETTPNVK